MERIDFCNTNGLVDGRSPKGIECPFKDKCIFAAFEMKGDAKCRRPDNMGVNFSCAAARLFSIIEEGKNKNE